MTTLNPLGTLTEFEQRLAKARTEIEKRIAEKKPNNEHSLRAHYYVSWLCNHVLGGVHHG